MYLPVIFIYLIIFNITYVIRLFNLNFNSFIFGVGHCFVFCSFPGKGLHFVKLFRTNPF
jgi:hypothetical protein